jgi:hypothetical protein
MPFSAGWASWSLFVLDWSGRRETGIEKNPVLRSSGRMGIGRNVAFRGPSAGLCASHSYLFALWVRDI